MKTIIQEYIPPIIWRRVSELRKRNNTLEKQEIPINKCVHLSGSKYGVNDYNQYESYLIDVNNGIPVSHARWRFIEYLLYYRPRNMREALGINFPIKEYPIWNFPWQKTFKENILKESGWFSTTYECKDVQRHFCKQGILSFRIDHEFIRLEQVYNSIKEYGYQPDLFSYVHVQQFKSSDGKASYLVLAGNHRISAMSALGYKTVMVSLSKNTVYEKDLENWHGVKKSLFSKEDALCLFNAYFNGNNNYRTTDKPATILAPQGWIELYFPSTQY